MQERGQKSIRPRSGRVLGRVAAALLFAAAFCQSGLAHAGPHGGARGFQGGGGFHGGEFHNSGSDGFHGGFDHDRRFEGFSSGGFGVATRPYYSYPFGWDYYPDYGYDSSQYDKPQVWYYCSDPAGYYPYVAPVHYRLADDPG
jgi:hypothetical protein